LAGSALISFGFKVVSFEFKSLIPKTYLKIPLTPFFKGGVLYISPFWKRETKKSEVQASDFHYIANSVLIHH